MTYQSEVLADSPLFALPLDDISGTIARDVSINNSPGTYSGSGVILGVDGPMASLAAQFNGSSGYMSKTIDLSPYTGITFEVLVNWDAFANDNKLLCEYSPIIDTNNAFLINPNASNGTAQGVMHDSHGFNDTGAPRSSWTAGLWVHVVYTFDKTQTDVNMIKAYFNGVLAGGIHANTNTCSDAFSNTVLYIMSRAGSSLFGSGKLAWVSLYPSVLSSTRIAAHSSAFDSSIPKRNGSGYIYENVGYNIVNNKEANGYIYENVETLIMKSKMGVPI